MVKRFAFPKKLINLVLINRCDKIMIEFLNEIKDRMEDSEEEKNRAARKQPEVIEFSRMINILVIHAQSEHVTLQVKLIF